MPDAGEKASARGCYQHKQTSFFLGAKLSQDAGCWKKIAIVFIYRKYQASSGKTVTKI